MSREYPRFPIPGVAAIVIKNNHVLLSVRGKPPSMGKWGLPGGVVEVGETTEDALVREVKEETNILVKPIKLLTVFDSINRDNEGNIRYHYILFEYLCEYVSGEVKAGSDAPCAKWVLINNLESINIMQTTLKFIRKTIEEESELKQ